MKIKILKHLKKQTREKLGPVPPAKVERSGKAYRRKVKHPKKKEEDGVSDILHTFTKI